MADQSDSDLEPNKATIRGIIRINQKKYTDAYIDNPENGPDIFVSPRGEALDGDLVDVMINPQDQWKLKFDVIVNNWNSYKAHLSPIISDKYLRDRSQVVCGIDDQKQETDEPPSDFQVPANLPSEIVNLKIEDVICFEFAPDIIQKTGHVTNLVKRNNNGIAGGFLKSYSRDNALFSPTDSRKPRMLININECPMDFLTEPARYSKILFIARMYEWNPDNKYALGNLLKIVGESNQIDARIETLLLENQICDEDFPQEVYDELSYLKKIPANWFKENSRDRRDLTNECIVSIDPKTARDLDDAVSIKSLSNDLYEVGVHIADVSYFVKEMTAVDYYARLRTTSVYLVDRVIPMLPRVLCEEMCSLNPGEPKLTYSVIWKLDKNGKIIDEWFGRTVIKTACKLAYEQAQDIIDRQGDISWINDGVNMPKLHAFNWSHVSRCIIELNTLAKKYRRDRFVGGALKIDQVKLKYELDSETGHPTGFSFEERGEANFLIEEFMLLANQSVAKRIYKHSDQLAFLRRHPPSNATALKEVKEFCDAKGYALDVTSSQSIQKSLNAITDPTISKVVSHLLLRTMKNAEYICVGKYPETGLGFHHYALNMPFYTHFTSPIRRYADIIVHRQLSLALGYEKMTNEDVDSLAMIAGECTKRKISSKLISDTSQKLYFNLFVLKAGFCELTGCVTKIYDHSFDVILVDYDRVGRVNINKAMDYLTDFKFTSFAGIRRLELNWSADKCNSFTMKNANGTTTTTTTSQMSNGSNEMEKKKFKKKKNKNKDKEEQVTLESRKELETGNLRNNHKPSTTKSAPGWTQIIEVFDLIQVIVTANKQDITQLNIDLKIPGQ